MNLSKPSHPDVVPLETNVKVALRTFKNASLEKAESDALDEGAILDWEAT